MQPLTLEIGSKDYLSPSAANAVVYGLHLALPAAIGGLALLAFWIAVLRARRADAQLAGRARGPGRAAVRGRVELAAGSALAVRVSIEQVGSERETKNGWSHGWREVDRRVEAAPFYLRDEHGERLRVEPDERVLLVDEPSRSVAGAGPARTRVIELSADEEVCAVGQLELGHDPEARAGYRDPRETLVLRPPRRGRLMLSSGPLGNRFREAGGAHLMLAIVTAGFIALFQAIDIGFHVRTFAGEPTAGVVTSAVPHKSSKTSSCELTIRAPDGDVFSEDVSYSWCSAVSAGARVPIVHVAAWSSLSQVGRGASVNAATAVVAAIVLGLIVLSYVFGRQKPWWEARLDERGEGRLPTS